MAYQGILEGVQERAEQNEPALLPGAALFGLEQETLASALRHAKHRRIRGIVCSQKHNRQARSQFEEPDTEHRKPSVSLAQEAQSHVGEPGIDRNE
jgi:hypothetical protein